VLRKNRFQRTEFYRSSLGLTRHDDHLYLIYHMNTLEKILPKVTVFQEKNPEGVVVIRWATATGKSSLSVQLARSLPAEIISSDSRQIYKHMDIGTDKVSREIRNEIPHHQIDIIDPKITYTAWERKQDVEKIIPTIHTRWKLPIVVWWTGLYIDTLYKNFKMPDVAPDEVRRAEMMKLEEKTPWYLHRRLQIIDPIETMKHHPNSTRYLLRALEICVKTGKTKTELAQQLPVQRPLLMIWLRREKVETNRRINARIKQMVAWGLIEEVQWLLDRGYTMDHTAMNGIGYKEVVRYIQWEYGKDKMIELLKRHTHRYAKRQRSWFRRYIAEGIQTPKENVQYDVIRL
jgi:tRNA dimethylallyltransferase